MNKYFALLLLLLGSVAFYGQSTITVTSIADSGPGSLRAAISSASSGDIVKFDPSLLSTGSQTVVLNTEISIPHGIKIIGTYNSSDTLFISGNYTTRLFTFTTSNANADHNLEFDSIVLINGSRPVSTPGTLDFFSGGLLNYTGADSVIFTNSILRNGRSKRGDALYLKHDTNSTSSYSLILDHSRVSKNRAYGSWNESTIEMADTAELLIVKSCTFLKNENRVIRGKANSVIIDSSHFIHNGYLNASIENGSVTIEGYQNVSVTHSRFIGNRASGAVTSLLVGSSNNVLFQDCLVSDSDMGSHAVSIFLSNNVEVNRVQFLDNDIRALGLGYNTPKPDTSVPRMNWVPQMRNCVFRNNRVAFWTDNIRIDSCIIVNSGNGSSFASSAATMRGPSLLYRCRLDSNDRSSEGGALTLEASPHTAYVEYCSFSHNKANRHSGGEGGAIFNRGDSLVVRNTLFAHNESTDYGGAVVMKEGAAFFESCSFIQNLATLTGGAIADLSNPRYGVCAYLKECLFNANSSLQLYSNNINSYGIVSLGHNVIPTGQHVQYHYTDQQTNSPSLLPFKPVQYTKYYAAHIPDSLNIAVNTGDPYSLEAALNDSVGITKRRDIGAFETHYQHTFYYRDTVICDSILINGVWRSSTGPYFVPLTTAQGQDSTFLMYVTKVSSSVHVQDSVFSCTPFRWIDQVVYPNDTSGVFVTLETSDGCDSVIELVLEVAGLSSGLTYQNGVISVNTPRAGATYQWVTCIGGNIPGGSMDTSHITPIANGSYKCIINYKGCVRETNCITVNDVGQTEHAVSNLRAYPNPTSGRVTLMLPDSPLKVDVFSITGELLLSMENVSGRTEITLPEPPGVYIIHATGEDVNLLQKVVKE